MNQETIQEQITDLINAVDRVADQIDKQNDFGYTVGDELHEMNFYLKEIMEALQKIANK